MVTEQRVKKVLADQFGVAADGIENTMCLKKDLGADSLDLIEIIMYLEDEFKIIIEDDSEVSTNIQSIIDFVEHKLPH
jgi:acyl carrier protein